MINTFSSVVTVIGKPEDVELFKTTHLDNDKRIKFEVAAPLGDQDPRDVWGAPACTPEHYEEEFYEDDGTLCVNVCVGSRGSIAKWFEKFSIDNPRFETHLNYVCPLINEKGTLIYKDGIKKLEIIAPNEE